MKPEVAIYDYGSIIQFEPLTPLAVEWFDDNVEAEPWQWLGGRLCVDHHFADGLAKELANSGFILSMP